MRYRALLFDVDGTLLDSAPDICGAVQTVLASTPRPDVPFDYLKSFIGRHLQDMFVDLFPAYEQPQIDELIAEYRRVYPQRSHANTRPYAGVVETLGSLPGRKATATTKASTTARIVLEKFGLLPHFHHVQGTDGFPSKPKPDVILKALEGLGATPDECLFVGDSAPDMEAGRAAGVHVCAVHYGYGRREDLARYQPEYAIETFAELAQILR